MVFAAIKRCCQACLCCCDAFWAFVCQERVLSPVLVLLVHALLVGDIFVYRPDLWEATDWSARCERLLVAVTVIIYLRTCVTDPGWVRPRECKPPAGSNGVCGGIWCCMCISAPVACCCGAALAASEIRTMRQTSKERGMSQPPPGVEGCGVDGNAQVSAGCDAGDSRAPPPMIGVSRSVEMAQIVGQPLGGDEEESLVAQPLPQHHLPFSQTTKQAEGIRERRSGLGPDAGLEEGAQNAGVATDEQGVELRWCKTCRMYQPLRTKHCRDCGLCVRTHDHHCPWIGSCVGEGNRVLFYWFLLFQATELAVFFVEGVQGISLLEPSVMLVAGLLIIAMFFIMVICLLGFHTFLLFSNLTTWEHVSWARITYLRRFPMDGGSPFGRSMLGNVAAYCCGPQWCPPLFRRIAALRYDEDGGVLWELNPDPRPPNCIMRLCADSC